MDNTISLHNGNFSKVAINHNLRKGKFREKEHIDQDGKFEIWQHQNLKEFYNQTFGDALNEYNQKQIKNNHPERQINNYYDYIRDSSAKAKPQLCYEMIAQVGSEKNPADERTAYNILKEFYLEFEKKNPNLKIVGCYYHADEATPHIHLDYVPVAGLAHPYKQGLKLQNSLTKACHEMGIEHKAHTTEQILLQEKIRDDLKSICSEYGINIVSADEIHNQIDIIKQHLDPEQYKAVKETISAIENYYQDYIRTEITQKDLATKKMINNLSQKIDDISKDLSESLRKEINNNFQEIIKSIVEQEQPPERLYNFDEQDEDLIL